MDKKQENFFKIFISEARDILSDISDDLLELENEPDNISVINNLFRHLHTLKGNASLDGFEKITEIAHVMENIFDRARESKLEIDPGKIDVLFEALDLLDELLEGLINAEYDKIDIKNVLDALHDINVVSASNALTPPKKAFIGGVKLSKQKRQDLKSRLTGKVKSYLIDLTFTEEKAGALNTYIIITNLKSVSIDVISSPPESELQNIKEFAKSQILILSSKSKGTLESKIKNNCETSVIIEADIDKIPSEEMELEKDESFTFDLSIKNKALVDNAVKNGEAYIIEMNFGAEDTMKNVNAFIVYNNLAGSSGLILSIPEMERIKNGTGFTKVNILYCGELSKKAISNKIKLNCKDYKIIKLNKENFISYIYISENKETQSEESDKNKQTDKKQKSKKTASMTVEVEKFIVDGVIENIGELVLNMNFISSLMTDIVEDETDDIEAIKENLKLLNAQVQGTTLLLNTLMDYAFVLRLVPLKRLFKKLPRMVRDASRKLNKSIDMEITGNSIRVDPDIINMLEGPIVHLLRNSIDHGIEEPEQRVKNGKNKTGVINLTAIQEHRDVIIEISDDGAGINTDKVLEKAIDKKLVSSKQAKKMDKQEIFKLLFHPGFSTKESAGELSGRGVGMDVVLHEVEKIGGSIEVESEKGKGTTFRLKFPVNA